MEYCLGSTSDILEGLYSCTNVNTSRDLLALNSLQSRVIEENHVGQSA